MQCDLWSETYERALDNVFDLREELSRAIVGALPLHTNPGTRPLVRVPTPVLDAYTFYLRGRYSTHKRTYEGLSLGVEYFRASGRAGSPVRPGACRTGRVLHPAGLPGVGQCPAAQVYAAGQGRGTGGIAARSSVAGGSHLARRHSLRLFDWDRPAAEEEFRRALQIRRENAYAEAWYAMFLSAMGRHEESISRVFYAETLEPAAPAIRLCVPRAYYFARQYSAALESLWKT